MRDRKLEEERILWRIPDVDVSSASAFVVEYAKSVGFKDGVKMAWMFIWQTCIGVRYIVESDDVVAYVWWRNFLTDEMLRREHRQRMIDEL